MTLPPLPDRLAGVHAKIDRATDQVEALHGEIQAFRHGEGYSISGKFEPERNSYVFRLHVIKQPPLRWGVVVGEIVHDLRSTLDHLAWQLIKLNGRQPRGNCGYPILPDEPEDFRTVVLGTAKHPGLLRGISDNAIALIEATQPYHGDDCRLLGALNKLWSVDKHRFLVPTYITIESAAVLSSRYLPNEDAGPTMAIKLGSFADEREAELVVVELRPTGPNPKVEMQGEPPIDIAFGGGPAVVGILVDATQFILTRVLGPLQNLFP